MSKNILKIFGQNVRKYRLEYGWSQEELARRCGLHRTYIGSIERSERNVSLTNVQLIANALEVKIEKLLY
jgi:transcriptional regulator with XRE-family HTH domain